MRVYQRVQNENDPLHKAACQSYQAWLGFYNGWLRKLGWNKQQLVEQANFYAQPCMGSQGVPRQRLSTETKWTEVRRPERIALIKQVLGQVVHQPTLKERPLFLVLQVEIPARRKIDGPHRHPFPDLISQKAEVANESTPFG